MIEVKVLYENQMVKELVMTGHANYAEAGQDIVCAAASSIAITTENAIQRFSPEILSVESSDGYLLIKVLRDDEPTQVLLENMIHLLKQLTRDYPKYIKLK